MENKENNVKTKEVEFDKEHALVLLTSGYGEAEKMLKNVDKIEKLLQRIEKKLKRIPHLGSILAHIPILISLVRSYIRKEYTEIPLGTIVAIVSALLYFISPIDIIPDSIPGIGYLDDAAVILCCLDMAESDINEYLKWRKIHKR